MSVVMCLSRFIWVLLPEIMKMHVDDDDLYKLHFVYFLSVVCIVL